MTQLGDYKGELNRIASKDELYLAVKDAMMGALNDDPDPVVYYKGTPNTEKVTAAPSAAHRKDRVMAVFRNADRNGVLAVSGVNMNMGISGAAEVQITAYADKLTTLSEFMNGIVPASKANLAPERVFRKCAHCGQWGAVMLPCGSCGAPIDPE